MGRSKGALLIHKASKTHTMMGRRSRHAFALRFLTVTLTVACCVHTTLSQADNTTNGESLYYIDGNNNETVTATEMEQVPCSSDQKTFVAETELIFEGSNRLLSTPGRTALQQVFLDIYNKLTSDSCDSYFRRLNELQFVEMSNRLNETLTFLDTEELLQLDEQPILGLPPEGGPPPIVEDGVFPPYNASDSFPPLPDGESLPALPNGETLPPLPNGETFPPFPENGELPQPPPDGTFPFPPPQGGGPPPGGPPPGGPPPGGPFGRMLQETTTSNNETDASTSITYNVTGTCRDCPVSRTGSFELFDDSFRRLLGDHLLGSGNEGINTAKDKESSGLRLRVRVRRLEVFPRQPPADDPLNLHGDSDNNNNNEDGQSDCTCAAGVQPLEGGQAPQISQLVEFINERLEKLKSANDDRPLFEDMLLANIFQLDDLSDISSNDTDITHEEDAPEESASVQKKGGLR